MELSAPGVKNVVSGAVGLGLHLGRPCSSPVTLGHLTLRASVSHLYNVGANAGRPRDSGAFLCIMLTLLSLFKVALGQVSYRHVDVSKGRLCEGGCSASHGQGADGR